MKNRKRQRENRKEEKLDKTNHTGVKDLTPYNAVRLMRSGKIYDIKYK
jgi:hypothetical protein